ncbi:MFS transporter [Cypionkella aquatica]|uniref:MFS transporter n=1 Tax=Cypionkella aquatica TaxID=1756042 RepID=A0AA37X090_9RHOB|nr:MFS transporter [Cypionkella aquatica]GLS87648.1 MFS transporter [Cypionkella aquatica]
MRNVLTALAIWAAGLGAAAQFGKMSVIYQQLGVQYAGHGGVGIGFMVSIIGIIGLIFGTTAGMLVSRLGPKRVMLAALALGAVVSLLQSTLPPFGWMLASRVPEGLSHLAIVVVGPTAIAATANLRFQPLVMTLWGSFFGVTFTVLALFGPDLVASHGIGALFQAHSAWLVFCLCLLVVLMPTDAARAPGSAFTGIIAQHIETYRSPRIAAPALGFVCYTVTYVAMLTLLPGAIGAQWGQVAAVAMPLVSIMISLTLGVWLLGRMSAVRLVQAGFACVIVASLGLWLVWGQGMWQAVFACAVAAAMGTVQGASFAAIPQLNAAVPDRARAAGAIAQLGNLGTTTGTPMLALILAQTGVSGLTLFLIAFSSLGIALHAWAARRRATQA